MNGRPEEVGRRVQSFYEAHPFPAFQQTRFSTRDDLRAAARWFPRQLDSDLPTGIRLADVGCGTGRLAALLSLRNRRVVGVDFSAASLDHALGLKRALALDKVSYVQGDLFRVPLLHGRFDVVLCLGVLHHTADPRQGFRALARLLRPGGIMLLGLYNRYGRLVHRLRQWRSAEGGPPGDPALLKARLRGQLPDEDQQADPAGLDSWYHDQYLHPHELTVSLAELGDWFSEAGLEPLGCFPRRRVFTGAPQPRQWLSDCGRPLGGWPAMAVQLKWVLTLRGAGGYFVQAGRLPARGGKGVGR